MTDRQDTDSTDIDFSKFQPISPPGGSANGGAIDVASQTQEFRISTTEEKRAQFVAGAFWSNTRSKRTFVRGSNSLDDYNINTPPGVIGVAIDPTRLPTTNDTTYSRYQATARSENFALFGQGSVALARTLDLLAGLRWSREKISYTFLDQVNNVAFGRPRCASETPSGITIQTCNEDDAFTGRFGLRAQAQENLMLFATYSRGRKGRAYDLSSTLTLRGPAPGTSPDAGKPLADVVAGNQPIPPEIADNYEIGFKTTFFDDRLTLNATAYHMVFKDFQAQSRDLLLGQNVLNSVGKVTSSGVEAEASARLGRFSVNAAASYNKARIDVFPNASCYRGQTAAQGCVSGVQNLAGASLPNAPEWAFTMQGEYSQPVSNAVEAFSTLTYRWQSAVNHSLLGDPAARQSAYGVLNVAAGLQTDSWKLTGFVNNLFDQRYMLNGGRDTHINNPPGAFATNWRPAREAQRTAGIRLSYAF